MSSWGSQDTECRLEDIPSLAIEPALFWIAWQGSEHRVQSPFEVPQPTHTNDCRPCDYISLYAHWGCCEPIPYSQPTLTKRKWEVKMGNGFQKHPDAGLVWSFSLKFSGFWCQSLLNKYSCGFNKCSHGCTFRPVAMPQGVSKLCTVVILKQFNVVSNGFECIFRKKVLKQTY